MNKTRIIAGMLLLFSVLFLPFSIALAATDGFYQVTEAAATWDSTDGSRTKSPSADYNYTYGDESSVTYSLPWQFNFYGRAYDKITADTNGNIWFGSTTSAHSFNLLYSGLGPVIAAWNNDLSSYYNGGVFIQHKADPERVVIEWQTETYTEEGFSRPNLFQVVLFPTGGIQFNYKSFSTVYGQDFGSGISSDNGTNYFSLTKSIAPTPALAGRSFMIAPTSLPAVTIDRVFSPTNLSTQTLTGTFRGASVALTADTAAVIGPVTYPTPSTWSCFVSGLIEGSNTITVTADDTSGNQTSSSTSLVIDTVPPVVLIAAPVGSVGAKPQIDYSAEDGMVTVKLDGIIVSKIAGDFLDALQPGEHTIRVEARDLAGNIGWAENAFIVDVSQPAVTIVSPTPGLTPNNTPLLSFTSSDGTVNVTVDGQSVLTTNGKNLDSLPDGPHSLRVEVTNYLGNMTSSEILFTVDTTPPGPANLEPVILAGYYSTLAVGKNGTLWGWGPNWFGELGDGTSNSRYSPAQIGADTDWLTIAGGVDHVIALKKDGSLWAWGRNWSGQLGDGTTTNRFTPTPIGTDTDWSAIAAGSSFTLALKKNGTLWAWGSNFYGNLGDGTTTDHLSPVQVSSLSNWIAIAAGYDHGIGLRADGSLWSWGNNFNGQLGIGSFESKSAPEPIGNDFDWRSVVSGGRHSLAVKADGSLWGWGDNYTGAVGIPVLQELTKPVKIGRDNDWLHVAGGDDHSLAIKADGSLWTWGLNLYGQLGNGQPGYTASDQRYFPGKVGIENSWLAVAAGGGVSFGAKTDGTLWVWGDTNGEPSLPTEVLSDAIAINTGAQLARSSEVTLSLVVEDAYGITGMQFSNNGVDWSEVEAFQPTKAWSLAAGTGFRTVYAKFQDTAGNWSETYTDSIEIVERPIVTLESPLNGATYREPALRFTASDGTVAITVDGNAISNNTVSLAGLSSGQHVIQIVVTNAEGKSGSATTTFAIDNSPPVITVNSPTSTRPSNSPLLDFILSDGSATVSIDNQYVPFTSGDRITVISEGWHTVQLTARDIIGNFSFTDIEVYIDTTPPKVAIGAPAYGSPVINPQTLAYSVSDGTVAVKLDGMTIDAVSGLQLPNLSPGFHLLRVESRDIAGNVGFDEVAFNVVTLPTIVIDSPLPGVTNQNSPLLKYTHDFETVTVKMDGIVLSKASGDHLDVLPDGQHFLQIEAKDTAGNVGYAEVNFVVDTIPPALTIPLQPVIIPKISKGYDHSVELLPNGTIWAWGLNDSGQLGIGTTTAKTYPAQIGTDSDWATISAGGVHTVAIKIDGSLWAWGSNSDGQLGDGSTSDKVIPVRIGEDTDWMAVSAGVFHTLAIKNNGTLWAWGWNRYGELGDGTMVSRTAPTPIGTDADWVSITAGSQYSSALKKDGSLWEWGSGTSSTIPVRTSEDRTWASISSTSHHLAIQLDGSLWAWGPNWNGELGDGSTVAKISPVGIDTGAVWRSIAAGDSFSLGIKSNGTLWAWGYNASGQIGDGTTTERHTPIQVGTDSTWSAVGAGWESSLATRDDGSVWVWGITGLAGIYDDIVSSPMLVPIVGRRTTIINGISYTANQVLPLQIDAADNTGVEEMRFKNENFEWSAPEPYAAVKRWKLSDGDGPKTVSMQLKDSGGNWSEIFTYSTILKTNTPQITINSPITGESTNVTPILQYSFSEGTVTVKIDDIVVDTTSGNSIGPLTEGPHTIRVEATDFVGNLGYDEVTFNVVDTGMKYSVSATNYDWIDISTTGNDASLGCDECSQMVPLGFEFSFYGTKVTNAYLQSNGYISFVNSDSSYDNVPVPSVADPDAFIAPFWDDLELTETGDVYYTTIGESPYRIFIAQWQNAPRYFFPDISLTFQVLLHEQDNKIVLQYQTLSGGIGAQGNFATVGIENYAGTSGTQYSYQEASLSSGLAIEFVPGVATPPVLSINPAVSPINQNTVVLSGTTDSGATVIITVDTVANVGPVSFSTPTTWSCTLSNLAEGLNAISVTATKEGLSTTATPIQLLCDTTPPSGSLSINGGSVATNSPQARLSLNANDLSGISEMRFSNDGTSWTSFEPFVSEKVWSLSLGDGTKHVYAQFLDGVGNLSASVTAGIILDTIPPVISLTTLSDGVSTSNETLQISGIISDEVGILNVTINGTTIPVNPDQSFSCTLSLLSGPNEVITIATDLAGNQVFDKRTIIYEPIIFRPSLSIGFSGTGSGTVVINPPATTCNSNCTISFDAGSVLTAHATPSEYSNFSGWFNSSCLGTGDCLITLNADTSITAEFERDVEHQVSIGTDYYPSLQDAYDATSTGDVLKLWGVQFDENLLFDRPISITLQGGFNDGYTSAAGETIINGTVTISEGMVTLDHITIK